MPSIMKSFVVCVCVVLTQPTFAGWEYKAKLDEPDGIDRSDVLASTDLYQGRDGLIIAVKCEVDGLNIRLTHKHMTGDADGAVRVLMRIDENETYGPEAWSLAANNKASWMPMNNVPGMVTQLRSGDKLVLQLTDPANGDVLNQTVSLFGISGEIDKLSCYKG